MKPSTLLVFLLSHLNSCYPTPVFLRLSNITSLGPETRIINLKDQISFPDQYEERIDTIEPKCTNGDTYCENFDGYPKEELWNILKKSEIVDFFFDKDEELILNRNGGYEEEVNYLCPSIEKTIFPKLGKTKSQKWKLIINQGDKGYIQGVRVEKCAKGKMGCEFVSLPMGYKAECKQKFIYKRMLSISDLGAPAPETFLFPSACCCSYKKDNEALLRFSDEKLKNFTPAKGSKRKN